MIAEVGTPPLVLTRAQSRELDRLAMEELGIPGLVLMENAGLGAALELAARHDLATTGVAVLCGGGNNGGDGYVVARQLAVRGARVHVFDWAPAERQRRDAAVNRAIVDRMGIERSDLRALDSASLARALAGVGLVVDGLLGTGFAGDVREPLAARIRALNAWRAGAPATVAALDLPSGLDADQGRRCEPIVVADLTLTFVAPKVGFAGASAWTGEVRVVPIGVPRALIERVADA